MTEELLEHIRKVWDKCYGEDIKEDYSAFYNALKKDIGDE